MIIKGRVWKFKDNIDTDVIIPATYLNSTDPAFLARYCLKPIQPDFAEKVEAGDIIVAGKNFGCGSSREHAPLALKGCRIAAVVAESFARIFFRNAINIGLPVIEAPGLARRVRFHDRIQINLDTGLITLLRTGVVIQGTAVTGLMRELIKAGGLMKYQHRRATRLKRKKI